MDHAVVGRHAQSAEARQLPQRLRIVDERVTDERRPGFRQPGHESLDQIPAQAAILEAVLDQNADLPGLLVRPAGAGEGEQRG